jgi:hypothetical protein
MMFCGGRLGGALDKLEILAYDVTRPCAYDQMSVT